MGVTPDLEQALSLQRAGRLEECKRIYRRLIRRRPDHHAALHGLGIAHAQQGDLAQAASFLKRAAALAPAQPLYQANLATVLKKQGRIEQSLEHYERAISLDADNPDIWNNYGSALLASQRVGDALVCFQEALRRAPQLVDALINAGIAYHACGRFAEAVEALRKAIALDPHSSDAYANLGLALYLDRKLPEAEAALTEAVRLDPASANAHNNLGLAYLAGENAAKAASCFETAIGIAPRLADAHANLAIALVQLGRSDEAIQHARQALTIEGELTHLSTTLGNVLRAAGRTGEALATLQRALERDPQSALARSAYGVALMAAGRIEEAASELGAVPAVCAKDASTLNNLGLCHLGLGDARAAVAAFRTARELDPTHLTAHSNLLLALNYLPEVSPAELYDAHKGFAETFERPLRAAWRRHRNDRDPERRLKLGYVSADFYEHAAALFSEPVLARHDKTRFELFCLHAGTQNDAVTARFRRHADHWHGIAHLADQDAFRLVQELGIDILVDLSGHTSGNRLGVFMRKPAPVQVHWLGYLTTTGLQSIDYRITDARADPPAQSDRHYSETLVRLTSVWGFDGPAQGAPSVSVLPCLESGSFTFGCLNALAKLTDEVLECWSALLREVPDSVLALGNAGQARSLARITRAFGARGIAASRLRFIPRVTVARFLDLHHGIDLALDPFPYNGGATTCHALWMGVPVVSLKGERYMARLGADMLEQLGLEGFVAASVDDYVRLAAGWSQRRSELAQIRRTLRERFRGSTLGNVGLITDELQSAYRAMWRKWCSS